MQMLNPSLNTSCIIQICGYLCNIRFYKRIFQKHQGIVVFLPLFLSFHEILLKIQVRVKLAEANKMKSKRHKNTRGKIYLYISVYNLVLMEILKAFQNLLGVKFNCGFFHWPPLRPQKSREAAYVI